jgi:hypothetical protein
MVLVPLLPSSSQSRKRASQAEARRRDDLVLSADSPLMSSDQGHDLPATMTLDSMRTR